jgi:hypothetical protein
MTKSCNFFLGLYQNMNLKKLVKDAIIIIQRFSGNRDIF